MRYMRAPSQRGAGLHFICCNRKTISALQINTRRTPVWGAVSPVYFCRFRLDRVHHQAALGHRLRTPKYGGACLTLKQRRGKIASTIDIYIYINLIKTIKILNFHNYIIFINMQCMYKYMLWYDIYNLLYGRQMSLRRSC